MWHDTSCRHDMHLTDDIHVTRQVITTSHDRWYPYHKTCVAYHATCVAHVAYHKTCHTDVRRQTCGIWQDTCLSSDAYHKTCVMSYHCHTQHVSFVAHILGPHGRCLSTLSYRLCFPHLCTTWIGPSSVRVMGWCLRGNTAAAALWPCVHFEGSLVQKERANIRDTSWLDGVRLEAVRQCWDRSLVLYLLAPVHGGYESICVCVYIRTHTNTHTQHWM